MTVTWRLLSVPWESSDWPWVADTVPCNHHLHHHHSQAVDTAGCRTTPPAAVPDSSTPTPTHTAMSQQRLSKHTAMSQHRHSNISLLDTYKPPRTHLPITTSTSAAVKLSSPTRLAVSAERVPPQGRYVTRLLQLNKCPETHILPREAWQYPHP